MPIKQIIPFIVLVLVTLVAGHFILGAGNHEVGPNPVQQFVFESTKIDIPDEPVVQATTTKTIVVPELPKQKEEVKQIPEPVVTDFYSCIDVTGTILESHPRQCVFSGKTFIEQIKDLVDIPGDAIELVVEVGPELVDCVGIVEQTCLVVDGDWFYDEIEGFAHEAGFSYTIKISRTLRWGTTDPAEIPADAGLYRYELVEILSQEAVTKENHCVVAGCSSQLCISREEAENGGGISTCEFREEYACYRFSECREQSDGQCGWSMTPEVTQCLEHPPTLE